METIARRRRRADAFDIALTGVLLLVMLLTIYPLYQCIVISLNDGADYTYNGTVFLWPRVFSLDSYAKVLSGGQFLLAARNTVVRTVLGAVLAVGVTSAFSFAISHGQLKLRKLYTVLGIITMYFSGGLIPTFLVIKDLGLYNNFLVYVLPGAFSMFNAMVFLAYFRGIPGEVEESALMDGANEVTIFLKIIAPIAKPVFACILLFAAVDQWNSYYDCMIYTNKPELSVLSYEFAKQLLTQQYLEESIKEIGDLSGEQIALIRGSVSSITLQMAMMTVTILPIMCVYPFLQRYFVQGVMVGSLKG